MTTTVKVHVNGNYRRSYSVNGQTPVPVGPNEEKSFTVPGDEEASITMTKEEAVEPAKDTGGDVA